MSVEGSLRGQFSCHLSDGSLLPDPPLPRTGPGPGVSRLGLSRPISTTGLEPPGASGLRPTGRHGLQDLSLQTTFPSGSEVPEGTRGWGWEWTVDGYVDDIECGRQDEAEDDLDDLPGNFRDVDVEDVGVDGAGWGGDSDSFVREWSGTESIRGGFWGRAEWGLGT